MTGFDALPDLREPPDPASAGASVRAVAALLGGCAVVGALLAPLVGWLWVVVANPPQVPLSAGGGIYLGEQALDQQSGVTMWFFVLGVGFGAVAGLVVGFFGQRYGWWTVVGVLMLCAAASTLSRYFGVHVFGPDPRSEVVGASVGDLIRVNVSLDTWIGYLGWPIGGLLGLLAAIAGWRRSSLPPQMPESSFTLE